MAMDLAVLNNNNLPAHLQAIKNAPAMVLGGQGDLRNSIRMKNGRFVLKMGSSQEQVVNALELPVVIVGAHDYVSRAWYKDKWVQGSKARPSCFSPDGITPSESSPEKQNTRCDACKWNQKGSSDNGGKACTFFKRIVVQLKGKNPPFILDVKSQSIFGSGDTAQQQYGLNDYSKLLSSKGINPSMVVTMLSFDPAASVPKIFFKPDSFLDEATALIVQKILADRETIDEYRAVELGSIGDAPDGNAAPINNGPAPSNIQQPAVTVAAAPQAQPIQAQAPKPVVATPTAPAVQKFTVSPEDRIIDVTPSQPANAPAGAVDINSLLDGIDFGVN